MRRRPLRAAIVIALGLGAVSCGSDDPPLVFDDPTTTTAPPSTVAAPVTTVAPSTSPPVAPVTTFVVPAEPPMVEWNGETRFLLGANLPWVNFGCDFGCGPDGGGASAPEVRDVVGAAMDQAASAGMNTVRWWLFPGDPWQITVDEGGLPTGIAPGVYEDIDAAVELADEHDLDLVLTLFSGPTAMPDAWRNTPEGRTRLAAALEPLFARYAATPRIMTWQIMNEPEWEIWGGNAGLNNVQDLIRKISDAVHANSPTLTSVGGARLDGLDMWVGLGLDYYTVHWYDGMTAPDECARCTSYGELATELGIDDPIVIGEFYLGPDVDGTARLEDFERLGYAGAWAWSLLPEKTADDLAVDFAAAAQFSGVD